MIVTKCRSLLGPYLCITSLRSALASTTYERKPRSCLLSIGMSQSAHRRRRPLQPPSSLRLRSLPSCAKFGLRSAPYPYGAARTWRASLRNRSTPSSIATPAATSVPKSQSRSSPHGQAICCGCAPVMHPSASSCSFRLLIVTRIPVW